MPRSPISVSKPLGSLAMKLIALARVAATVSSSSVAPGRPYSMFSRMVPENRLESWNTTPISLRSATVGTSRTDWPCTRISPLVAG